MILFFLESNCSNSWVKFSPANAASADEIPIAIGTAAFREDRV
ncbi:hypothetical protein ACFOG5_20170 [Pedobacter fastidiosus]|nr:hypothetical protein [Pedobacter fastidiosus]